MTEALLDSQISAALVGAVATTATALMGLSAVVWQMGRQSRNALKENRHLEELKLKLEIYREITSGSVSLSDAVSDLSNYIERFRKSLSVNRGARLSDMPTVEPPERLDTLVDKKAALNAPLTEIFRTIDRWQIVDPRVNLFKVAFFSIAHEIQTAFDRYLEMAYGIMPMADLENPEKTIRQWSLPTENALDQFDGKTEFLLSKLKDAEGYAYDFQTEMQKLLLGELFDNEINPRRPTRDGAVVIDLRFTDHLSKVLSMRIPSK